MTLSLILLHPDPEPCRAFERRFANLPHVTVLQARYESAPPHDCFATAGNAFGLMTAGVDAAVVHKFGPQIMTAVQHHILNHYLGEQPVGTAFILPTHNPNYPFLCHAPTMRVPGSIENTDKVYTATWAALLAVHAHNQTHPHKIETLALPALGTGFGSVPHDESARQMAAAYRHYLAPPKHLDWDAVIERQKAIFYDGAKRVVR